MTGYILRKAAKGLIALLFTEKMLVGIALDLLGLIARKTSMKVDDKWVEQLQQEYDKKYS